MLNPDVPSIARIYDYVLGGALNFECDRKTAEKVLQILPGYRDFALANRAFLHRGVRAMLQLGIRQFLDLGSGLPTASPVHDIAHRVDPASRVVYVDIDPVAVFHSRLVVGDDPRLGVVEADMIEVDKVLDAPDTRRVLDLSRPVGLLMVGVLHFLPEPGEIRQAMAAYHRRLPPGTMLLASHATGDNLSPAVTAAAEQGFASFGIRVRARRRDEFRSLLGPWQLTEDGVADTTRWRADNLVELHRPGSLGYALMAAHEHEPRPGH